MFISKISQDGFFLTFTCNQSEHFGLSRIKNWLDGKLWASYFPSYFSLSIDEQNEIATGLQQAASGLILRNWMEVRKIFVNYLYMSSSSPYHPSDAIFARDEYQSDAGNLPHVHMMISMDIKSMNSSQIDKMDDLIRASVVEIVRSDELQDYVDQGVLESVEHVYTVKELAKNPF